MTPRPPQAATPPRVEQAAVTGTLTRPAGLPALALAVDNAAGGSGRLTMLLQLRAFVSEEIAAERKRLALCDEHTALEAACEVYGVDVEAVLTTSRKGHVVKARQMACWLMYEQDCSLAHIGRYIGRDHTTVIHAVRRVEKDHAMRAIGRALLARIGGAA